MSDPGDADRDPGSTPGADRAESEGTVPVERYVVEGTRRERKAAFARQALRDLLARIDRERGRA